MKFGKPIQGFVLSAFICGVVLAPVPAMAQTPNAYEAAVKEYWNFRVQDKQRVFQIFKSMAEGGNAAAQYNLGVMYKHGAGVPISFTESMKWYGKAQAQGYRRGEAKYGSFGNGKETSIPIDHSATAIATRERANRSVEEVIALHLPHIVERRLSPKEKAAIPVLFNIFQSDPSWANMQPLMYLAESGDKKAMMAVLNAFDEPRRLYDAPFETWGEKPASLGIAGRWGAEYWIRHGKNRTALQAISDCPLPTYVANARIIQEKYEIIYECGLGLELNSKQRLRFAKSSREGRGKLPKLEFNLTSPYRDGAGLRERFETLRKKLTVDKNGKIKMYPGPRDWLKTYIMIHPEAAPLLQESLDIARGNEAGRIASGREFMARRRSMQRDTFNALLSKDTLSTQEQRNLENAAAALGDAELSQFSSRYLLKESMNIKRVCALNDSSCSVQTNAENARQAAFNQEIRQENRDAIARENALKVTGKSNLVTVRQYDRNGKYLGTIQMTKAQADIAGVK